MTWATVCRLTVRLEVVIGGGDGGRESSFTDPRRDAESPCRKVLIDGDGGVAVSDEIVGGAAAARLRARYDRYDGPVVCFIGKDGESSVSKVSGPELVHRSIRSCVVSSGRLVNIARPYRARLLSAYTSRMKTKGKKKNEGTYCLGSKPPEIHQCILIIPRILNLNPQIILMSFILLGQVRGMLEVFGLSTHSNSSLQIER